MGVLRGKTDKADCKTIAQYACRFCDSLKQYILPGSTLLRLKALFSQRERLVDMHRQIQLADQSMKGYPPELIKDIRKQNARLLKNLSLQIKQADKSIKECLASDAQLQ